MKRILYITIIGLLALTGCKKEPTLSDLLCNEWRGQELTVNAGIYISFAPDGTFELYQKLNTDKFELRRGRWSLEGNILSGTYNDGENWSASYRISIHDGTLTLVSQNINGETNVYKQVSIPQPIKEMCTIIVKSRTS